ncbi:MAG TPA: hypothetical protein PKA10_04850 [Selenomonadales bacterium]|nr:hypothetical protein [Selenomonadales bacterium]
MIDKAKVMDAFKANLPAADQATVERLAQETISDASAILHSIIRQKALQERQLLYKKSSSELPKE